MNKTIKVIELLNKIANGEEVPEKIKYGCSIYEFNEDCKQYYEEGTGTYLKNKLTYDKSIEQNFYGDFLNDEVEIIEESKQDIDIQAINELDNWFVDKSERYRELDIQAINLCFRKKINELVQAVKQLDNQIKEKNG